MGNGVRQCAVCGWTCYGSRVEMKKHRRAKHPRPTPARGSVPPLPVKFEDMLPAELRDYPGRALAEMDAADHEELLDVIDHLHDDLRAIREHLGIARPECEPRPDEPPAPE